MKLCALDVQNLLSFDSFHLDFLATRTVLVGPNGVGKSNVVRMVDLAATAVTWADEQHTQGLTAAATRRVLEGYAQARRQDGQVLPTRVRLEFELTTQVERERVVACVQAAVLSTLLGELSGLQDPSALAQWVAGQVNATGLAPLLGRGAILLDHSGAPDAVWEVAYEFQHGGATYRWVLASGRTTGLVRADGPLPATEPVRSSSLLTELVLGIPQSAGPHSLPDPMPDFNIEALLPEPGRTLNLAVQGYPVFRFDLSLAPYRRFVEGNRIRVGSRMPDRLYSLARPLRLAFDEGLAVVAEHPRGVGTGLTPARQAGVYAWDELSSPPARREPYALPLRLFALKNGTAADRSRFQRIGTAFSKLAAGRGVEVRFQAVAAGPTPASTPTPQPALMPGGLDVGLAAAAVNALNFAPQASASEMPNTEVPAASVGAEITLLITEDDAPGAPGRPRDLPIFTVGAGVWEALLVSEALTDTAGRTALLDEPALNLHPTWQRALRAQLGDTPGQVVLVTHSPYLVPMADHGDLSCIVRLDLDAAAATRTHRLPSALDPVMVARIAREFELSADARSLLFARGAVLVEGWTELGALPVWFRSAASVRGLPAPEELDLGFHCVAGDKNFKVPVAVLIGLGIPWAVVCDGAIFNLARNNPSHLFRQVAAAGYTAPDLAAFLAEIDGARPGTTRMSRRLFATELALARQHGMFSLARGWRTANKRTGSPGDESFEVFVESVATGMIAKARKEVGESKVRQGQWIAQEVPCPAEVADLYVALVDHLGRSAQASEPRLTP